MSSTKSRSEAPPVSITCSWTAPTTACTRRTDRAWRSWIRIPGKHLGTVSDLRGVHGVVPVPEMNKGFITNGQANSVVMFDLKTFAKMGEIPTGTNPDAICYEPQTKRIFAFNGRSNDATAIDAASGKAIATFAVGPKPENCATDRAGKVYVNIENSSEVVEIDAAKPAVLRRAPLAPCEEPSGMAIDLKGRKLFSVCGNNVMAVTDIRR